MTQVVLIRPGATAYDEQHRLQGILDIPLSERGRAEVALLAESLPKMLSGLTLVLSALYCGPTESVVRTAEAVGKALGLRPKRIDDLRNLNQGLWQGLPLDEIKRRNQRVYRQWLDDPTTVCPPQGETMDAAFERIKSALRPLIKRHQNEAIAIVAGDPLSRLIACFLKRETRVQLHDDFPTGGFERIEILPETGRNGSNSGYGVGNSPDPEPR